MRQNQVIFHSEKPFHLKYRPNKFSQVVGQDHITSYLKKAILSKRVTFAYLFIGKHGVGKTTISRLVSKSVNCSKSYLSCGYEPCNNCQSCINITLGKSFDVHEINAAVNTGIDNIRDIIEKVQLAPVNNICKVCIIDEVHMLSLNAFNALLKILEEPPKNVLFILATTDPKRIPSTVVSRCHKLYFLPLKRKDLALAITHVIWTEKGNVTNKAISQVLDASEGSFRDALTMIDMLMIQDNNINQNTYSFLFNNVSYSISELFLKYSVSKDMKKILQLSQYLEKKIWLETTLMSQMQKIFQEDIMENIPSYGDNEYLILLWQLLIRYNPSNFPQGNFSFFIADLIFLFSQNSFSPSLYGPKNKKKIPMFIKVNDPFIY